MTRAIPGLLLWLCIPFLAQEQARSAGGRGGIAARVNDEIITWDEIAVQLKDFKPDQITEELRRSHLRQLAEERLFLQEAKRLKIQVTEEDVDAGVKRVIKSLGDESKYDEWRRFRKITKEAHRSELRKEILEMRLYIHLIQDCWKGGDTPLLVDFISPEEIRAFYEGHKENYRALREAVVWRIGLQWQTQEEKAAKRRLAESLLRKLAEGTDFITLAAHYSDISHTDEKGQVIFGFKDLKPDNDFFSKETNRTLFQVLEVGKTSGIIEEGKSLNVFLLEQRVDRKEETFEEAQIKIRAELEHRKREENRKRLRDEILKKAYIWPEDLFKN